MKMVCLIRSFFFFTIIAFKVFIVCTGDQIRRGCVSDLPETEVSQCFVQDQQFCKTCMGNDCNSKVKPQTCYNCRSTNDENCTNNVTAIQPTECRRYHDQCITIVEKNVVVRDCLRNIFNDDKYCSSNPTLCNICNEDDCNSTPLVEDKYCYACNSDNDPNCRANLNDTMITKCPISANNVGCYHFADNSGNFCS